jgi:hypothetical protein
MPVDVPGSTETSTAWCKLKNDVLYKGIRLPDGLTEIKMIIHADDTTLFSESVTSLIRFLEVYNVPLCSRFGSGN